MILEYQGIKYIFEKLQQKFLDTTNIVLDIF